MTAEANVLEIRDVGKSYGSTRALDHATLNIRRGALHVILGENGAGKSTLLHVIAGLVSHDSGDVVWAEGTNANGRRVGIVHQHSALVPALTAAENFALGTSTLGTRFDARRVGAQMREIAASVGLGVDPDTVVAHTSIAERQRVEIVRAVAKRPALLLLDEPTAVLPPGEAAALYDWIRRYVRAGGTIVVVTHRLTEAMAAADDITVMRRGAAVASAGRSAFTEASLLAAILGDGGIETTRRSPGPPALSHAVVASLRGVRVAGNARRAPLDVEAFDLHRGELVGVAGVDGAGQREFLRVLAGRLRPDAGDVVHAGADIGFIPEDRHAEGVIDAWGITENLALRGANRRHGRFVPDTLGPHADRLIARFDVRGAQAGAALASLSGGNQQKFIVARELDPRPDILVAENPTRGLDVRASAFVRAQLVEAAREGCGVVVYSSDLEELLALSDRILVCHAGRVLESPPDLGTVGRLMVTGRPS